MDFVFFEQINGLFRGGTATIMRETMGNMLFFTTYETTRYHLFTSLGLDPNRAKGFQTDEDGSTQSMVANTLLETGIGIITGGLAGVAVSVLDHSLTLSGFYNDLSFDWSYCGVCDLGQIACVGFGK